MFLDDERCPANSSYHSLQRKILDGFTPERSSLATWTTLLVKHHKELNRFLLQHGVYLVSDWAILNDTSTKQLQRIFSEFYQLTESEIQQASQLLESYHSVYRTQRLQQRQRGMTGKCLPPSTEQLQQICRGLSAPVASEVLIAKLQKIASQLREYRVHVRGGTLAQESINVPNSEADKNSNNVSYS